MLFQKRVIVNGSQSTWININSGIPQVSVLGPVLFLVFINDLPEVINVLLKLFADDTKLYSVVSSNADNWAQFSLNRAVDWASIWKMIFNIIKCHHLHIRKKIHCMYHLQNFYLYIEKLLNYLNPSKASGPDLVPARILRLASKEISPVLSLIYQQS